ncbi:MAG: UDP-N-acetylglucosamine 2-epimerase (non-hydrolyzing) [Chloroflexi bacterium]|nr:UDP-N-acetylglucosamine 2-epimerase (non-hydrolyzing) [Chloroflexota bacterium]
MIKAMLVVGARPNFMKAASLVRAIQDDPNFDLALIHTGQHYDDKMSHIFFEELGLPKPDVDLGVGSASHTEQTARVMLALEPEIIARQPNLVIVVGDVNSTLAAGLVASKHNIQLSHIEAGLRSFDRTMPEEINRIVTDALADYLLTPSPDADENLKREGIAPEKIFFVGNVMIDTLLRFKQIALGLETWTRFDLQPRAYSLVTLHRPANVDGAAQLQDLVNALMDIARQMPVVFPIHPRTRANLIRFGLLDALANAGIILTEPLGYLEFQSLMSQARVVLTDSGGIQEETTVLGIHCLTLRENTERPITVTQGTNQLVGLTRARIVAAFNAVLSQDHASPRLPHLWDGHASERIVKILRDAIH